MKVQELIQDIRVGEETVFDVSEKDGLKTLKVELRKLNPEAPRAPTRAESPARAHVFHDAASFGAYLAKYGGPKTVVFADMAQEEFHAILDETAPKGFETVALKPEPHPLWTPWAELEDEAKSVEEFAQFVVKNRRAIVEPNGKELAFLLSQVRATVSVEIQKGRGKDAINGVMVKTMIQGQEKKESIEIPDEITIRVPLYVATEKQDIELDICLEADRGGDVTVLVSAGTLAEARCKAFEEMVAKIRAATAEIGATVGYGAPKHGEWKYLPELPLNGVGAGTPGRF